MLGADGNKEKFKNNISYNFTINNGFSNDTDANTSFS